MLNPKPFKRKEQISILIAWLITASPLILGLLLVLFNVLSFPQLLFIFSLIGFIAILFQFCFKFPLFAFFLFILFR